MSCKPPAIVWVRQDLRLRDNPELTAAADSGHPVLPVHALDDKNADDWRIGAAGRWWLHQSLEWLNASLGHHHRCFEGDAAQILTQRAEDPGAEGVYWHRCNESWRIRRDRRIKAELREKGYLADSFNGSLLFEPRNVTKADGSPYKVFTPHFRRGCPGNASPPRFPTDAPEFTSFCKTPLGLELDELERSKHGEQRPSVGSMGETA